MAICVDAGPGRRLQAATASSNSTAPSQRRRSTHSSRSSAMWAGGPPNPTTPIRVHARAISAADARTLGVVERLADELGGDPVARDLDLDGAVHVGRQERVG